MASRPEPSLFFNILLEEFKKKPQNVDVVGEKKKRFNLMLDKANDNLKLKQYTEAKQCYFNILQYMKKEPYLDELDLSEETIFAIECCMCFSTFMDVSSNTTASETCPVNDLAHDILNKLNEVHCKKLFVKFLDIVSYIGKKKWVTILYLCNVVEQLQANDGFTFPPAYESILPSRQEMMENLELYKMKAFHCYGLDLIKCSLLTSKDDHYEFLCSEINQLISSKFSNLDTSVSETDLHVLIHQFASPLWLTKKQDEHYQYYYDEKYISKCEDCNFAFQHFLKHGTTPINQKHSVTLLELFKLHNSLIQCPFLDKIEAGVKTKLKEIDDMVKTPAKKKKKNNSVALTNVAQTQTDKVKVGCRYVQTEAPKYKNVDVQVNFDSMLLNTMSDLKNRVVAQEKKDNDGSVKLNKKINEINDLLVKASAKIKSLEEEVSRTKKNEHELELNKLKQLLAQSEKQNKTLKERNVCLQKQLVEQTNDKYNIHKSMCKTNEKKSQFMVHYLKELSNFLTPNSIPNDATIKQNINIWETYLKKIQEDLDMLNSFYGKVRADMLHSDKFSALWPEIRELPKDEENIIFKSFTPAIKHMINIEEKMFSQCKTGLPLQPQQFVSFPQNLQYANATFQQFVPQSSSFYAVAPSPNYANALSPQTSLPPNTSQQLQQPRPRTFSEMQRQQSGSERGPQGNHKLRASKSSECLNKAGIEKKEMKVFVEKKKKKAPMQLAREPPQANNSGYQEKEKILYHYVVENCRGATEDEVLTAMLRVVDEKGTLSKLSKEQILEEVRTVIRMKKQRAWVTPKSPHVDWQNDHSENNCSICFENFSIGKTYTLRCQHVYHKECIKRWLKTSSVCPICRIHSVIDDEFPPLQ